MTIPVVPDSFGLDRALAAGFFHARDGETISEMAGHGQVAGKLWACRLCKLLDLIVARGHCAQAISTDGATAGRAAVRAGIALWLGVALPASLACWAFWEVVLQLVLLV